MLLRNFHASVRIKARHRQCTFIMFSHVSDRLCAIFLFISRPPFPHHDSRYPLLHLTHHLSPTTSEYAIESRIRLASLPPRPCFFFICFTSGISLSRRMHRRHKSNGKSKKVFTLQIHAFENAIVVGSVYRPAVNATNRSNRSNRVINHVRDEISA